MTETKKFKSMKKLEFNPAMIAMSIMGEEMQEGKEILASVKRSGECSFEITEQSVTETIGHAAGGTVPQALAAVTGQPRHRRNKKLLNGRYISLVYMEYCDCYQIHGKRLSLPAGFDKQALGEAIGREVAEALAIIFDRLKNN